MAVCGIGNDRAGLTAGESTAPYSGFSNLKKAIMANQIAQTAQYPIQKPTTASAYLAAVAIPNSCYDPMACRWHPLGFYPTKQAAHTACLAFIDTLPPEIYGYTPFTALKARQPGISGFYDKLLERLNQGKSQHA